MIGYYAHSHGSGHCNYANILARTFKDDMVVFTSRNHEFYKDTNVVYLPDEDLDGTELSPELFPEPVYLHHAPLHLKKIQIRNFALLKEIIAQGVKLLIVDVSVEIAALARVCSIPYVYVRMFGERSDTPHIGAYQGAAFLIAYYPEELEPDDTPLWVRKKTLYLGFFSRYSHSSLTWPAALKTLNLPPDAKVITYMQGFGGNGQSQDCVNQLAEEFPEYHIYVLGAEEVNSPYSKVTYAGFVKDPSVYIKVSDFVAGPCGMTAVAEIADLDARYIAIPEQRPFYEQECLAKRLMELNLISVKHKSNSFTQCRSQLNNNATAWNPYVSPNGPQQFYDWLQALNYDVEFLRSSLNQARSIKDHAQILSNQKQLAG